MHQVREEEVENNNASNDHHGKHDGMMQS